MASKKSNEDAFNRMNFLYQAANMCLKMPTEQSVRMAAYYGMLLRSVGKKAQARMDPSMKRTLCKGCHTVLVPGVTATVRLQKRPASHIIWLCKCCSTIKRFNLRKDYKVWVERDEAVVEHNKPADVRTDRNAAGTSGNKAENIKSNGSKQNKHVTVNKTDLVSTSVIPADKADGNVSAVKLCDSVSSNKINSSVINMKQCDFNNAGKVNDNVNYITLSDVDPSNKINPSRNDSNQRNIDPTDDLKVIISDIRLCETNSSDNINLSASDIKQYIDSIDKVSDIKLSDIYPSYKINACNSSNKLYNIDTVDKFKDIKVSDDAQSMEINTHNSDVKQCSIHLAGKLKEDVSDTKQSDNSVSDYINDNVNSIGLSKNNETSVAMDVDSGNINETDVDKAMDIDSSNTVEETH